MRPRKKTQGEKTQEFRNSRKKTQTQAKNSTFRHFVEKILKKLEKIMNFSLPYVKKPAKVTIFTKNSRKNSKLKDFSKNSSQKTQFPAFSKSMDLRKVH